MRKKMMAAVCMAAVSLVLTGCGSGAADDAVQKNAETADSGIKQGGGQAGHESRDAQEQDIVRESEETADGEDEAESADSGPGAAAEFAGKTISILGDSISTFRGHNPEGYAVFFPEYGAVKTVEDTWWQRVVDDLELTLYQNGSSSGASVTGDSTGTEDPLCACNELRTGALTGPQGACPEIIIVFLGTNDLLNSVSLGTNDGTILVEQGEITAFSDAYTLMLDKLQSKYPPAEIYCCTIPPVGDYGTDTPYVDFENGEGLTAADYNSSIVQIAKNRGHIVVDLQNCGITIDNLAQMTTDGVHPTADGMVCIAEAVKRALTGQ